MNRYLALGLACCSLATSAALGQGSSEPAARLIELPANTQLNQFRISARMGYNISARLDNLAPSPSQSFPLPPAPKDGSAFRSATGILYQDGYVGIDESGNAPLPGQTQGRTFYWGYARADQIADLNQDGTPDTLLLSHSASGTLFEQFRNDPQPGMEFTYARQIGQRDRSVLGFETAFSYTSLDLHSHSIADPALLGVHAFSLGNPSIVPPAPPYTGPFQLEPPFGAPSIFDSPTAYPTTLDTSFDADLFGWKVGPYFQFPVAKRLSFALSGGFSLLIANTQMRIQQSLSLPGASLASASASNSDLAVLPGCYVAGRLNLMASDSVNVFTGLQYESNAHHSQTLAGKRIDIDFWNALYWTFGVSYSF